MFLPPKHQVTMLFMKDLLSRKKLAFKRSEVKHIIVPVEKCLSMKRVLNMVFE